MKRVDRTLLAGLTLVSVLTLAYEVMQTRVFSYSLHPVVAYLAIAIAMLGFGLGATILSLRRSRSTDGIHVRLSWMSVALMVSVVFVNAWFARTSIHVVDPDTMQVSVPWAAIVLLPCIVPYLLAGWITATVLDAGLEEIGAVYSWNLAGSAAGCVISMILLRPLGAERIMMIVAAAAAAAAMLFALRQRGPAKWVGAACTAVGIGLVFVAPQVLPFRPDLNEAVSIIERMDSASGRPAPVMEFTEWDPLGRIDVVKHGRSKIYIEESTRYRSVTIDGGAVTLLVEDVGTEGWGKALFADSIYGAAHRMRENGDVLIIGVGGGTDINAALFFGARSITGVEISQGTLNAITGPYARFAGFPQRPEVTLVHSDGRSFAKSTDLRFDVIQLSGVDTITVHSTGSMVLAEDYLYTTDAFADFLSILKRGGILSVTRFGREAISLSAIAAASLRRIGAAHPEDHIAALRQERMSGILVKKEPWSDSEIAQILAMEDRTSDTALSIPHYDEIGLKLASPIQVLHPRGRKPDPRFDVFFEAMKENRETAVLRDMEIPFIVPTDDRPYYMMGYWMTLLSRELPTNPLPRLIFVSTLIVAAAAFLLILLPVFWMRRRAGAGAMVSSQVIVYFFMLGACFMLLEVGLIHRMLVFVGTPGAAVSVVLASILVSSGIGSRVTSMLKAPAHRLLAAALGGLVAVGLIMAFAGEAILEPLFGLPMWARGITAAVILAPAGFFMGWFFPLGLSVTSRTGASLVPWAIGVNGFASVIGSLAVLPLSMALGFRAITVVAAVGYVLAVAVMTPLASRAVKPGD